MSQPYDEEEQFNPVAFVTIKERKDPLRRAVAIATTAKDVFSIGEAVIDGYSFFHYAMAARNFAGSP